MTKERYGDVTGQLGDTFPHPKQDKLGFVRINQKVFCVTPLCNAWRRHESMCFDVNEKYILVPSTYDSMVLNLMTSGRSFMYRLKSVGPRIEPGGTLCVIVSGSDNNVATE